MLCLQLLMFWVCSCGRVSKTCQRYVSKEVMRIFAEEKKNNAAVEPCRYWYWFYRERERDMIWWRKKRDWIRSKRNPKRITKYLWHWILLSLWFLFLCLSLSLLSICSLCECVISKIPKLTNHPLTSSCIYSIKTTTLYVHTCPVSLFCFIAHRLLSEWKRFVCWSL